MYCVQRTVLFAFSVLMLSLACGQGIGVTAMAQTPSTPKTILEEGTHAPEVGVGNLEKVRADMAKLRREFNRRISEVELWFKDEVERLDARLNRESELAKLRNEMAQLRAEQNQLAVAVTDHGSAIDEHQDSITDNGREINDSKKDLAKNTQSLENHDQRLNDHGQTLETQAGTLDIQKTTLQDHSLVLTQQELDIAEAFVRLDDAKQNLDELVARVLDISREDFGTEGYRLKLLGNMKTHPELRDELFRNARYRLRIHNTPAANSRYS